MKIYKSLFALPVLIIIPFVSSSCDKPISYNERADNLFNTYGDSSKWPEAAHVSNEQGAYDSYKDYLFGQDASNAKTVDFITYFIYSNIYLQKGLQIIPGETFLPATKSLFSLGDKVNHFFSCGSIGAKNTLSSNSQKITIWYSGYLQVQFKEDIGSSIKKGDAWQWIFNFSTDITPASFDVIDQDFELSATADEHKIFGLVQCLTTDTPEPMISIDSIINEGTSEIILFNHLVV